MNRPSLALALPLPAGSRPRPALEAVEPLETTSAGPGGPRPGDDPPPGLRSPETRSFGRYELLVEMGQGGMATLFLARLRGADHFDKLVAVKRIHAQLCREPEFVKMFLDEARIAGLIQHPNVATVFDVGQVQGLHYLAMEYVPGADLHEVLKAACRHPDAFPWPLAARIVADAAAGLHAAHTLRTAAGEPLHVVHRDVSPQNLLVAWEGHVKVVDFGIAYAAQRLSGTAVGTLKGKIPYMSPEQAAGEIVDARSDVFALGTVLFESTTLSRLFRQDTEMATLLAVRAADVPSPRERNAAIPVPLERIILRALARRPEDRFASAQELSEQLEAVLRPVGDQASRTRLAAALETLVGDRRRIREAQIRSALASPSLGPLPAVVGEGTSSSLHVDAPARRSAGAWPRALVIAATVAMVALGGLLAGRLLSRPGDRSAAPPLAPTATAPADVARPGAAAPRPAPAPARVPAPAPVAAPAPTPPPAPATAPPSPARREEMRPRPRKKMSTLLELDRPTPPPPPRKRPRPRARLLDL